MCIGRVSTATLLLLIAISAPAEDAAISQGEYLINAGGCVDCHTEDIDDAIPLAGGRAVESPFGTFYSPNITPDVETGIGAWSDDDFVNAFWEGVDPDGDHYYPAFPYTSYTGVYGNAEDAMEALGEIAEGGDMEAIGNAFMNVGKACKGCHDSFREEHEHEH